MASSLAYFSWNESLADSAPGRPALLTISAPSSSSSLRPTPTAHPAWQVVRHLRRRHHEQVHRGMLGDVEAYRTHEG